MNTFLNAVNTARTENGALALASSGSELVNLFGLGGAMRKKSASDMKSLFASAYSEDKLLATKIAFYFRDVRGGQGERDAFRNISDWLVDNDPNVLVKNLEHIPQFGRWDDLVRLVFSNDEMVSSVALAIVEKQLNEDKVAEHPSLLAKWMPSENASDKETIRDARKLAKKLGLTRAQYRKEYLSPIRAKITLVETLMCHREWNGVDYEKVPSRAAMLYRKAFKKHDEARYNEYLGAVEKGEKTIKASTLYPSDIVSKFLSYRPSADRTLEAQWKALPNYLEDNEDGNGIVVADVSGSMSGEPMAVSIALAIYMAERNVGPFKDAFFTFASNPKLELLKGNSLLEKVQNLSRADWGTSTDIDAVFRTMLDRAKAANVSAEDMPKTIYIISDMQFNIASRTQTNFEYWKTMYESSGYKKPRIVFWNVRASSKQVPASANEDDVFLVSGYSPVIFEQVMKAKAVTAYDLMLETLSKPRYDVVTV